MNHQSTILAEGSSDGSRGLRKSLPPKHEKIVKKASLSDFRVL